MRRALSYALGLGLGWLGLMAGGMFIPGAAPAALVLLPARDFLSRLPAGAGLLDAPGPGRVTVAGATAGQLYRAGAGLVLPAGLPPCVAPPRDLASP